MNGQIFISHSKQDPNLGFFDKIFAGTNVRRVCMEFEEIKPPPWEFIKESVSISCMIFVLLSEHVSFRNQTRNWVSFEIGLAAAQGKKVVVFRPPDQEINFPIPYCTHFMIYHPDSPEDFQFIKKFVISLGEYETGLIFTCSNEKCELRFRLLEDLQRTITPNGLTLWDTGCPSCGAVAFLTNSNPQGP